MRKNQSYARITGLIWLFCLLCISSSAQQQGQLARNCRGEKYQLPPEAKPACNYWVIELYEAGKVWGAITSQTRDGAVRELESTRQMWRNDPKFLQHWASPSEPICEICGLSSSAEGLSKSMYPQVCEKYFISDEARLCYGAKTTIQNWAGRVGKAFLQLQTASEHGRPFASLFTVAGDYLSAMWQSHARVNELQDKLNRVTNWSEIKAGMEELERDMNNMDQKYRNLPSDVICWLEGCGGNSILLDGLWIGPEWQGGQRQGLLIAQDGSKLSIYEPATRQFLFQGTLNSSEFTTTTERKPTELTSDQVRTCSLSSNILYSNVSLRGTLSSDGKSFTLEQITEKVQVGSCTFGGIINLGTWYKR